jgi:uncharacterized repeat protein (TIGR01451 family)
VCSAAALPAFAFGRAPLPAISQTGEDEDDADVQLNVTGGRNAEPGKGVRYRFRVRNTGQVPLSDVSVSTRLPRTLEHLRGGRFRAARRTVVFSLGRIAPGGARSRLLVARVAEAGDPERRIVLRARVEARPVAGSD